MADSLTDLEKAQVDSLLKLQELKKHEITALVIQRKHAEREAILKGDLLDLKETELYWIKQEITNILEGETE